MFPADEVNLPILVPELQKLHHPLLHKAGVEVDVLRFDNIHPLISGNKYFKLRYYLQQAKREGKGIVTFGGPWSNHLHATAAACQQLGLPCTGIVRGERPAVLSDTLTDCSAAGMQLLYSDRDAYRRREVPRSILSSNLLIPEGGASPLGVSGAAGMLDYIRCSDFSELACSIGTGTMMAGLLQQQHMTVRGFLALKLAAEADQSIEPWIRAQAGGENFKVEREFHFGGYGRHPDVLLRFMQDFFETTGIPTDIVYTGKMFYGLLELVRHGRIQPGSRICAIHSGGLQGNRSLPPGTFPF